MKKYFSFLLLLLSGFAFVACEDVPEPYGINLEAAKSGSLVEGQLINEAFTSGLGSFQVKSLLGLYAWAYEGHGCVQVTSYENSTNNDADSYLISPAVTLEDKAYHLSFEYILRYAQESSMAKNHTVLISDNFDKDPSEANWTLLEFDIQQGSDWDNWFKADINIPDAYRGKKVNIAFRYIGDTTKAATWEVRKCVLAEGTAAANPDDVVGDVTFFSESFASGAGECTTQDVVVPSGTTGIWKYDSSYKCMKATGFISQAALVTEAWLYTSLIDLRKSTGAYLSFEHACNKFTNPMSEQATVWAKATSDAEWTKLTVENYPSSWTFIKSGNINLEAFVGKKIQIAFKYTSTTASAGTWEVKNVKVTGFGETGSNGFGWEDFTNGDFESWTTAIKPAGWQDDTSVGDADLQRSEDAHAGTYSCRIVGSTAISRSLAYQPMQLSAGTYTVSCYAKAATADAASLRLGCKVTGEEKDRIERNAAEKAVSHTLGAQWEQFSFTFTLDPAGDGSDYSVVLFFRNMKSEGKDLLIDDVTITKAQ